MKKVLFVVISFFCFFKMVSATEITLEALLEENRSLKEDLQKASERASYFAGLSEDLQKQAITLFEEVTLLKSQLVLLEEYTCLVQQYAAEIDRLRLLHYEDQQLLEHYDSILLEVDAKKEELKKKLEDAEKERLEYIELQNEMEMERNQLIIESEKLEKEREGFEEQIIDLKEQLSLKKEENESLLVHLEEKTFEIKKKEEHWGTREEQYIQKELFLKEEFKKLEEQLLLRETEKGQLFQEIENQKLELWKKQQILNQNKNCDKEKEKYETEILLFQKVQNEKKVCEEKEEWLSLEYEKLKGSNDLLKEKFKQSKVEQFVYNPILLQNQIFKEEGVSFKTKASSFSFISLLILGFLSFIFYKNRRKKSKENKI